MTHNELGFIKSIEKVRNADDGAMVLEVVAHFYDGNCPAVTFKTVWERIPIRITECRDEPQLSSN